MLLITFDHIFINRQILWGLVKAQALFLYILMEKSVSSSVSVGQQILFFFGYDINMKGTSSNLITGTQEEEIQASTKGL